MREYVVVAPADFWRRGCWTTLSTIDQQQHAIKDKHLTHLKQQPETAWLRAMDSQSLQQALRDLDSAYQQFFRRLKQGQKKKGFPTFKSRKTDTLRFRIPQRVVLEDGLVSIPKIGQIRAIVHRLVVVYAVSCANERLPLE